jgi:release factor glutamine methyltransferase
MAPAANAGVAVAPLGGANPTIVDQARRFWAAEFRAAGLDSPELDARILVGHVLSLDHAGLVAAGARKLAG